MLSCLRTSFPALEHHFQLLNVRFCSKCDHFKLEVCTCVRAYLSLDVQGTYVCPKKRSQLTPCPKNILHVCGCAKFCTFTLLHTFSHINAKETRGKANSIPLENNPWNYGGITIAENMSLLLDIFLCLHHCARSFWRIFPTLVFCVSCMVYQ